MKTLKEISIISLMTLAGVAQPLAGFAQDEGKFQPSFQILSEKQVEDRLRITVEKPKWSEEWMGRKDNKDVQYFGGSIQALPQIQTGKAVPMYQGTVLPKPPGQEGIPDAGLSSDLAELLDGVGGTEDVFRSEEQIRLALFKSEDFKGFGSQITFFEQQAAEIIENSGTRNDERLVRFTINRAVDLVHHILPYVSRNADKTKVLIANTYRKCFELARAFATNRAEYSFLSTLFGEDAFEKQTQDSYERLNKAIRKNFYVAEYGRIFTQITLGLSSDAGISNTGRSIALMRGTQYLLLDLISDLNVNNRNIRKAIIDVAGLLRSETYAKLYNSIVSKREPMQGDVDQYQLLLNRIVNGTEVGANDSLYARLRAAGIPEIASSITDTLAAGSNALVFEK